MLKSLRDYLVSWKFRIGYLNGFLTTFAAIIIIANTLQTKILLLGVAINYFWVLSTVILLIMLGSYLLDRFGFIESEIDYGNSKNKLMKKIGGE